MSFSTLSEDSERFGLRDLYVEVQRERRTDWGAVVVAVGGATDADFRPQASVRLGLAREAPHGMTWRVDVAAARYVDDDVYTVQAGFEQRFAYAHASLAARVIASGDARASAGYAVQGELDLRPRVRGRLGYADAPEFSEGAVLQVQTWNAALLVEASDTVVLRADVAREDRGAYTRDVLRIGAGIRFAP
ncbi:MAG: YaiO family outer membrane beta-barrel protein [Hyphomonadaceae bacterium]